MKRCALLTCPELTGTILDEDHLEKALENRGWTYSWFDWQDDTLDWNQWDCAIVRTTWDYIEDLSGFLAQLKKIDKSTCRLFNDFETIQWNSDKRYLQDLSDKGVSTIPTMWLESPSFDEISQKIRDLGTEKAVIKPQCGAGAKNTFVVSLKLVNSHLSFRGICRSSSSRFT